jgi:hypothetical protein
VVSANLAMQRRRQYIDPDVDQLSNVAGAILWLWWALNPGVPCAIRDELRKVGVEVDNVGLRHALLKLRRRGFDVRRVGDTTAGQYALFRDPLPDPLPGIPGAVVPRTPLGQFSRRQNNGYQIELALGD